MNFTIEIKRNSILLGVTQSKYMLLREQLFSKLVDAAKREEDFFCVLNAPMRQRFEEVMQDILAFSYEEEDDCLSLDEDDYEYVLYGKEGTLHYWCFSPDQPAVSID